MQEEAGAERLVLKDGAVQRFLCISNSRGFAGLGQCCGGEEAGFEELRAERRGKAFTRSGQRKERSFAKWGSGFGSGFTQWRLTWGWAGR